MGGCFFGVPQELGALIADKDEEGYSDCDGEDEGGGLDARGAGVGMGRDSTDGARGALIAGGGAEGAGRGV